MLIANFGALLWLSCAIAWLIVEFLAPLAHDWKSATLTKWRYGDRCPEGVLKTNQGAT